MKPFDRLESEVRSYCRSFPEVFARTKGSCVIDGSGEEYIADDGITHGLDMATEAKATFLEAFERIVLQPRALQYKVMFPGPTGTNSVEAALKLARKITNRVGVMAFTNGFHGMTLGSLALTGNQSKRAGAGVPLTHVTRLPFDGYFGDDVDTIEYADTLLSDASSGVDAPAAFIVETVQAEGGINVASHRWLRGLQALAKKHGSLLIVDDIQVGCGRTGPFFSFERAGVQPDGDKAKIVRSALDSLAGEFGDEVRGRGLIQGLALDSDTTAAVCREAFNRGVVMETAGAEDEVAKILPPLTIQPDILEDGLQIVRDAIRHVTDRKSTHGPPRTLQIAP